LVWPDDPYGPSRSGNLDGVGQIDDPDRRNQPNDLYRLVMPVKFISLVGLVGSVEHVRVVGLVGSYGSLDLPNTFMSSSLPGTPRSPIPPNLCGLSDPTGLFGSSGLFGTSSSPDPFVFSGTLECLDHGDHPACFGR